MSVKIYLLIASFAIVCGYYHVEAGECFNIWAKDDAVGQIVSAIADRCPMFPGLESEYCCYNMKLEPRCCTMNEFAINMVIGLVIVVILLALLSFICSCLFCKCW